MHLPTLVALLFSLIPIALASDIAPLRNRNGPDGSTLMDSIFGRTANLFLRQNDNCGDGTRCVNSVCCGPAYCIPAGGQCCDKAGTVFCYAGETCMLGSGGIWCKNSAGATISAHTSAAAKTTATATTAIVTNTMKTTNTVSATVSTPATVTSTIPGATVIVKSGTCKNGFPHAVVIASIFAMLLF
ncbi:hypothetical protein BGZ60DRAFT_521653 [Tricladium varicosporioides]|nr:hypothetical protein BGZ60DRAFT_521653 [Hymenoscyphus varicosporioides]